MKPAKVEVAAVSVAVRYPTVGLEVAPTDPVPVQNVRVLGEPEPVREEPRLRHVPETAKQPAARLMPFENDEEAAPVTLRRVVCTPPAKVEVERFVTARLARVVEPAARKPEKVEVELVPETLRKPAKVEVAVLEVAVNDPARAFVPKSEDPYTERARCGDVVPIPILPERTETKAMGSNQILAVVVALPPMVTMSVGLLEKLMS